MTQAALSFARAKRFSKGPYATTTARFDDSGDFAATAWQGEAPRSAHQRSGGLDSTRWLASPATSANLLVFMLPVDAAGTEPSPTANVTASNLEQLAAGAVAAMDEGDVYGVYAPPRPRKVLFPEVVEFRTDKLPRRKPRITGDDSFLAVIDDE